MSDDEEEERRRRNAEAQRNMELGLIGRGFRAAGNLFRRMWTALFG